MSQKKYRKLRAMAKVKEEKINELGLEVVNDISKRKSFWDLIKKIGVFAKLLIGTYFIFKGSAFVSMIMQNFTHPKFGCKDAFASGNDF